MFRGTFTHDHAIILGSYKSAANSTCDRTNGWCLKYLVSPWVEPRECKNGAKGYNNSIIYYDRIKKTLPNGNPGVVFTRWSEFSSELLREELRISVDTTKWRAEYFSQDFLG